MSPRFWGLVSVLALDIGHGGGHIEPDKEPESCAP
jgi:hypothetical protein